MPSQFAAYLRVYEPLTAFAPERERFWRRYVDEGRAVGVSDGPGRQRATVLEALGAGWSRLPDLPDEAYVMQGLTGQTEVTLVCPWNLRVRVAEAALQARDGVPQVLADAFVPPVLVDLAQTVVEQTRAEDRMHEQVATWGVPLRWFVLVSPAERDLVLEPTRRVLRYRTEIGKARQRAHKGLRVLRRTLGDVPITDSLRETARWLESFHPGSVVELDYGGLTGLLPEEALRDDDSVELVATGLAGLEREDGDAATAAYEQLVQRWRAIQLMERSN
ncbi:MULTISPECIES: hypothetical protein [Catellatospora]|uniref:DUF8083 domain-containing protein n=1 Tax=Catellatospora citrea TaxID=53366 RepID=A0A8J3P5Z5_9ACTN|nr:MULTISPECIES: hypothetical protein [Catellatospora]RKE09064.1 hypothetical protein C8E86_3940 [Catellatospora citrea]GIG02891.1 hypothetical protein Cci01nite_79840 [Catellatospora citrea]